MYFIPAFFAVITHLCASKSMGLKNCINLLYSFTCMFRLFITHSPSPGILNTPQWMNIPNFMSWKSCRAARLEAAGVYPFDDSCAAHNKIKNEKQKLMMIFLMIIDY